MTILKPIAASVAFLLTIPFLALGCATGETALTGEEPAAQEPQAVERESVTEQTPALPQVEQAAEANEEPQGIEEASEVVEEPIEEPVSDDQQVFEVTEELYSETFEDIRAVIEELNHVILTESFNKWLSYLTPEYIAHFSDPGVLREASDQPLLRNYGIRLRTLRDYFNYVVVPSRSNVRLDQIVFVDTEKVTALMVIDGQRTILYQLELNNGKWQIGI